MEIITHQRNAINISQSERMASAVSGGLLAAAGMKRGDIAGLALALIGGDLLRRAITGHSYAYEALGVRTAKNGQGAETTSVPYELGIRVDQAITISQPRADVYRFWRNLSNLPRFMNHVESVREIDSQRSHWCVKAPAGRQVEWDAIIHNEVEGELIAWRSLPGAEVDSAGTVMFKDAPGGRGTELRVELQYNPPGGALGAVLAKLWGEEPSQQVHEDLLRLKQILEAGEVPTTTGQPTGQRSNPAHAVARQSDRDVQRASEESFPASDPPAFQPAGTRSL
jgi:uncharacterized membrane protein